MSIDSSAPILNNQKTNTLRQQRMQQTAESVWEKCLSFVEDNIDPQAFKTWFKPIVPVKLKDNALST